MTSLRRVFLLVLGGALLLLPEAGGAQVPELGQERGYSEYLLALVTVMPAVVDPAGSRGIPLAPLSGAGEVSLDPRLSPRAASLSIRVVAGTEYAISLDLPSELSLRDGSASLPIEFGAESACWASGGRLSECVPFDPESTGADPLSVDADGTLRLGGRVIADPSAVPGDYSGVVTATIQFASS